MFFHRSESFIYETPDPTEIKHMILKYVDIRLKSSESVYHDLEQAIKASENLQSQLWSNAVKNAKQNPSALSSLFLQALNDMIDMHQSRITVGLEHRMPAVYWYLLYDLLITAMIVAGYDAGLASRNRFIISLLAVSMAFSLVLLLIVALERPMTKLGMVSNSSLYDLQQDIRDSLKSQ